MNALRDKMIALRTLLLKMPAAYEGVQRLRDRRLHSESVRGGSFAQHGEDLQLITLLRSLGARGPYVDVGANHPFRLSNTYLLYRSGWRGVCVDPLPRFKPLYQRWRPEDRFVCTAVGETAGQIDLHQFEWDPLSTLDESLAEQYIRSGFKRLQRLPVSVRTIDEVLDESGITGPLSLLSIDIEGHEVPALKSMNLDKWQPAVICIEAVTLGGARNEKALTYLQARGYKVHGDLGLNVVFVRNT